MIVTVLPCDGIDPGTMKCLHVIAEIHETRSMSSVFGFRFSLRRLPSGSLRHESPPVDEGALVCSPAAAAAGPTVAVTSSSSAASVLPMRR